MYIPSWDTFDQTIQRPEWLGLLKTDSIITWYYGLIEMS